MWCIMSLVIKHPQNTFHFMLSFFFFSSKKTLVNRMLNIANTLTQEHTERRREADKESQISPFAELEITQTCWLSSYQPLHAKSFTLFSHSLPPARPNLHVFNRPTVYCRCFYIPISHSSDLDTSHCSQRDQHMNN